MTPHRDTELVVEDEVKRQIDVAPYPRRLRNDSHYKVPTIRQRTDRTISFKAMPKRAIHSTPVPGMPPLRWYVNLKKSRVLRVVFTGYVNRKRFSIPKFNRVSTSVASDDAYLAFADPALEMDPTLGLAWHVGTPGSDLTERIVRIIERVKRQVQASTVELIGGSGGGFTALRVGALIEDAAVYVFSPQTMITTFFIPNHVRKMLRTCFPDLNEDFTAFASEHPLFNDVAALYESTGSGTPIYYFQNINDPEHVRDQFGPFTARMLVLEERGLRPKGSYQWALVDSVDGHGDLTPDEFEEHHVLARRHFAAFAPQNDMSTSIAEVSESPRPNDEARPARRVFIYGSCVTRDGVDFWDESKWSLADYIARQSLISADEPADLGLFDTTKIASKFQRRMAENDIRGNVTEELVKNAGNLDIVLWDLTDERLGVLDVPGGGTVSRVVRYDTGIYRSADRIGPPITMRGAQHLDRWRHSADRFLKRLSDASMLDKLVVNATPWAEWDETGAATAASGLSAAEFNEAIERYYEHLESNGVPVARIDPRDAIARSDHKWGPAPFHYVDATYLAAMAVVDRVVVDRAYEPHTARS